MKSTIVLGWINVDGEEVEHEFPCKNEVCSRCEGYGTHLNPSIGNHAYTWEEFNDSFDDEGQEEYFRRGGMYDVRCEECNGDRVVQVVDESRLSKNDKALYMEWQNHDAERARWDAEDRHTRWCEDGCPSD